MGFWTARCRRVIAVAVCTNQHHGVVGLARVAPAPTAEVRARVGTNSARFDLQVPPRPGHYGSLRVSILKSYIEPVSTAKGRLKLSGPKSARTAMRTEFRALAHCVRRQNLPGFVGVKPEINTPKTPHMAHNATPSRL